MAVTPTQAIADFGNGDGFIYITKPNGITILTNIKNDRGGVRTALADGSNSAPIVGDIDATGTIRISTPDTDGPARNITNITVNGVSVIDTASSIVITGAKEITDVTCPADVADSLNSKYWFLDSPDEKFYVNYRSDPGTYSDPQPIGRTRILVIIATNDTATAVATATASAIAAVADFGATSSGAVVTVTNDQPGKVDDAVDVNAGVTVNVTTQGDNGRNDVAGKIESAIDTFTPTSGVVYDATVTDNVVTLHAPAGQGKTLNGHVIIVTENSTSVVIDIENIDGGNDGSGIIDPTYDIDIT